MTLDEMAAEVMEAWAAADPEMAALWDRGALWARAEMLAGRARAAARAFGMSERGALMEELAAHPLPGVPGG